MKSNGKEHYWVDRKCQADLSKSKRKVEFVAKAIDEYH